MTRRNSEFACSRSCQHLGAVCPIDRFPFHDRSISWTWLNLQGCTMCTTFQSQPLANWLKHLTGVHQQNRMSIHELHFESSFPGYPHLPDLAYVPLALYQVAWKVGKWVSHERAFKGQYRYAHFRSLVYTSQKLWPKPD